MPISVSAQQNFTNFQAASRVVGQANFTTISAALSASGLNAPSNSAISAQGRLAVANQGGGRVMIWNNFTSNGQPADLVLGQPSFTNGGSTLDASTITNCNGVAFSPDGNKIIASDYSRNRVLIWNTIPGSNGAPADVVLGQPNFTSSAVGGNTTGMNGPTGVYVSPDGRLFVSDYLNNRVLVWNSIPTVNGTPANVVIGQPDFLTGSAGTTASKLSGPWGICAAPTGELFIADGNNSRVLLWNSIPTSNGAPANLVIGQPNFTSNAAGTTASVMAGPIGVTVSPSGQVAISEFFNNRVLIYDNYPVNNGAAANRVLGQSNFTNNLIYAPSSTPSAQNMNTGYNASYDLYGRLFVTGREMNRVLVFGTLPAQTANLQISITSSNAGACANAPTILTITVSNSGPSSATGVRVYASLPYGFTLGSAVPSQGNYFATGGAWSIGTIPNGGSAVLTLNGTTGAIGQFTAAASIVACFQLDADLTNNASSITYDIAAASSYFNDSDGDGSGDPNNSIVACSPPNGYVANSNDLCPEDANKVVPGVCGCGMPDVPTTWYADPDGDGLGDPNDSQAGYTCNQPAGYVEDNTDQCDGAVNDIPNFDENTCACELGYFATVTDIGGNDVITACAVCPPGSFCPDGLVVIQCPAGRYQDQEGQTACNACNPGTFNPSPGATSCQACPVGTFGAVPEATSCTPCDAGFANGSVGQTACTACPAGSYSANSGQEACDLCPANTYNPLAAQTYCLACPNGEISDEGAIACTQACTENVTVELRTDLLSAQASWQILAQNTDDVLCQFTVPIDGITTPITENCCLPEGCYRLRVLDSGGDGYVNGGYQLRESGANGRRIIDNLGNFNNGSSSALAATYDNGAFCLPIGDVKPIFSSCDKLDWVNNKFIVAAADPAVSAQFGVANTTSGYEFWFYDPNGSYSFRRFRSHATSDGFGSGATRACHFKVNGWVNSVATPHLPANTLLNVRIRGRVNSGNLPFGPACLFKIDPALAACPPVKLQDDPANTSDFSCGVARNFGGPSNPGNRIYANPPQPVPAVAGNMVRYQFRFRIPGEGVCIARPPQTSARLVLNWTNGAPLECTKTYAVDVRVSLDAGATWCFGPATSNAALACSDTDDWGKLCEVTINPCAQGQQGGGDNMSVSGGGTFTLYPNPNRGDQLFVSMTDLAVNVELLSVDIFDLTGKCVEARTIPVKHGAVNTELDLGGQLAGGLYLVHVTAGENVHTERLVIQP